MGNFNDNDCTSTPSEVQLLTVKQHASIGFEAVKYDKDGVTTYFKLTDGWVATKYVGEE